MEELASAPTPSEMSSRSSIHPAVRVAWAAGFALLLLYALVSLASGDALRSLAGQWLVGVGLPALPDFIPKESFLVYLLALRFISLTIFWLVALLIFWRRPGDWVVLLVSTVLVLLPFSLVLGEDNAPWQTLLTFLGLALFLLTLFLFPDGRFIPQSARGRILMALALLATPFLSLALIAVLFPSYPQDELGYAAFLFTLSAAMACGIASQVYRFRFMSGLTERQQTKWVLFGLGAQLIWIAWWIVSIVLVINLNVQALWALVTLHINVLVPLLIPVTFGLAILRYRLWDVDPLINRTLVYGTLTAVIILLYVLIVGALGLLFQARGNLLASLLATGAIAVAFQPLRQRLQKAVDKIMYGQRNDPIGMLTQLTRQLEAAGEAEDLLPGLVETVAIALKFPYVAIELPGENGQAWMSVASMGLPQMHVEYFALRHKNQEIGRLLVAPRSPGEQLAEADRLLLVNIAQLLAATVQTLQLNVQLRQSRRQLVTAREEERRRIRRDLHDGLGPVLASLTLQADTTADLVHSDPDQAITALKKMRDKTQAAVIDIRHLVQGLRPPALDELGLAGAIHQYIASLEPGQLSFKVEVPDSLPALPAAVEVAAYRITQEAVANVTRHAQATTCTVHVALDGGLCLQIIDDGVGIPEDRTTGIGLKSMRERAAELGGACTTETTPTGGTRVVAQLPFNGLTE